MPQNLIQFPKKAEINADNARMEIIDHEISYMEYDDESDSTNHSWFDLRYIFDFISSVLLEGNQDFFKELDEHGMSYEIMADICATEIEKDDKGIPILKDDSYWCNRNLVFVHQDSYFSEIQSRMVNDSMSEKKCQRCWDALNVGFNFDKIISNLEKHVKTSCIEMIRECNNWDELRTRLQSLLEYAENTANEGVSEAYHAAFEDAKEKIKTSAGTAA